MNTYLFYGLRLTLLCLAGASLAAQGISNVSVTYITYSSAIINWTTSTSQSSLIQYGTTAALGTDQNERTPVSVTAHQQFLSGLSGDTTYYYKVCNNSSSCDPTIRTFVTAAKPVPTPALPIPAARYAVPDKPVVPANRQFTIAADCSDLQSRINAVAQLDGTLDYEILIPVSSDCTVIRDSGLGDANQSSLILPAKSGPNSGGAGEIIIRSAAADSELPTPGSRVDPSFFSRMPTLRNNAWGVSELGSPNSYGTCTEGQLWWDFITALGNTWSMKACSSPSTNGYSLVAKTTFSGTPPASCTPSTWYYKNDTGAAHRGIYWCGPAGKPYHMQLGRVFCFSFAAGAHHYRFFGLQVSVVPFSNPHPNFLNTYGADGTYYVGHFKIPASAHHIIFDRCRLTGLDYPQRIQNLINSEASYLAFTGNYMDKVSYWLPNSSAGSNSTETQIFNISGGDMLLFDNNMLEGSGFGIISSDDTTGMTSNVVVTRNDILKPSRYRLGSTENAAAGGWFYHARHCIELKNGERWLIDGNVCDGNFATVNNGHFIAFSPRPGTVSTRKLQDIQFTNNTMRNGPAGIYVIGHNDLVGLQMSVARRILIANNQMLGIDGAAFSVLGGTRIGHCFTVQFGVEDLTLRHNLCRDNKGLWPAFLWQQYGPSAGLDFRDNIIWHSVANGYGGLVAPGCLMGTASLNCEWNGWRMERNALVNSSGQNPSSYPSNNFWPAAESGLQFADAANGNFRLQNNSPFRSGMAVTAGVSGPASDGASIGPDYYDIDRAHGAIGPLAIRAGDQHVTLMFSSGYTGVCAADFGTDPAFAGSFTRTATSSGTNSRLISVSGLVPNTVYYYRLLCGSVKTGSFQTATAAGQAAVLSVAVNPPSAWTPVTSAVAEFGVTTGLGSFSVTQPCVGGCTLFVPSVAGRVTYYRVHYRNIANQTFAQSAIMAAIP